MTVHEVLVQYESRLIELQTAMAQRTEVLAALARIDDGSAINAARDAGFLSFILFSIIPLGAAGL